MKVYTAEPNKCTGCHLCEMACSFKHHRIFSAELSNIRIESNEDKAFHIAAKCMQCEEAYCIKSCVSGALYKNYDTGAVQIERSKCIGCKACVMACPFGAVSLIKAEGKLHISICDLCSGDPECIKVCSSKAIEYVDETRINKKKRNEALNRSMETSEGGAIGG